MKVHEHMLRGYEMSGERTKAIGTLLDASGAVCALGAYFLSKHGDAEVCDKEDWQDINTKFCDAYGLDIVEANNGTTSDADCCPDENGQRGFSIPTIAGMLKAIGL